MSCEFFTIADENIIEKYPKWYFTDIKNIAQFFNRGRYIYHIIPQITTATRPPENGVYWEFPQNQFTIGEKWDLFDYKTYLIMQQDFGFELDKMDAFELYCKIGNDIEKLDYIIDIYNFKKYPKLISGLHWGMIEKLYLNNLDKCVGLVIKMHTFAALENRPNYEELVTKLMMSDNVKFSNDVLLKIIKSLDRFKNKQIAYFLLNTYLTRNKTYN